VLSELAGVPVVVQWESPSWRVRWVDGPTRAQLLDRTSALDGYGIGAPLAVAQMRFSRRVSTVATAVGWLAHGSQGGMAAQYDVDLWCADTAYPQRRAGAELLATAVVLATVTRGDSAVLATLMTSAQPPLQPAALPGPVIDELPGRVVSFSWPGRGGPPAHLLQPTDTPETPRTAGSTGPDANTFNAHRRVRPVRWPATGPVSHPRGTAGAVLQRSMPRCGPPSTDRSVRHVRYVAPGGVP